MQTAFRFVLLLLTLSATAWGGEKESTRPATCGNQVAPNQTASPMQATKVRTLRRPVGNWIKFHETKTGRLVLAYDVGGTSVPIFAPEESARALWTAQAAKGAIFTGAHLFDDRALRLATTDDQGGITTHTQGREPRTQRWQPVLTSMDPNVQLDQFAVGLGVMCRVRIVPIGSTEVREFLVDGTVIGVSTHVTNSGRHLLAVATENSLKVFDVNGESTDTPLYKTRTTSPTTLFNWAVDDRGESVLIYIDGETLVIRNPQVPSERAVTSPVGQVRSLQTLRLANGSNLILSNRGVHESPELQVYKGGELSRDERLASVTGSATLVPGPGEAPSVIFGRSGAANVARLDAVGAPVERIPLADDEALVSVASHRINENRSFVAIGTTRAAYVLKLDQPKARR